MPRSFHCFMYPSVANPGVAQCSAQRQQTASNTNSACQRDASCVSDTRRSIALPFARIAHMPRTGTRHHGRSASPVWMWPTVVTVTWVLAGLVGHDPWKADEAHTFGVVLDFLRLGDWGVPSFAREPFMGKPPLFYVVAGAAARGFRRLLPNHAA